MTAVTAPKAQARDLEADLAICEAAEKGDAVSLGFVIDAPAGWAYAIRRALEAEAEVDKLRNEISQIYEALNQHVHGSEADEP